MKRRLLMPFELPRLPYPKDALAPLISAETLKFHYGHHHRGYVEKLNELTAGTAFSTMSLREIVLKSKEEIFNNAAQSWNHAFYWDCLCPPDLQKKGSQTFLAQVKKDFGGLAGLKKSIRECGLNTF